MAELLLGGVFACEKQLQWSAPFCRLKPVESSFNDSSFIRRVSSVDCDTSCFYLFLLFLLLLSDCCGGRFAFGVGGFCRLWMGFFLVDIDCFMTGDFVLFNFVVFPAARGEGVVSSVKHCELF